MPIYDIPNLTSGIDEAIVETATTVSIFTPMLLVFVFSVVFLTGMNRQRKRVGSADAPMWAVIASMSIFLISLSLTLTSGLIDLLTLSIVISITILSGIWLFLSRNRNEI